jgi:hypothetical protein
VIAGFLLLATALENYGTVRIARKRDHRTSNFFAKAGRHGEKQYSVESSRDYQTKGDDEPQSASVGGAIFTGHTIDQGGDQKWAQNGNQGCHNGDNLRFLVVQSEFGHVLLDVRVQAAEACGK